MDKKYSEKEIKVLISGITSLDGFYVKKLVNLFNTVEYNEIVAKKLLDRGIADFLRQAPGRITRKSSYRVHPGPIAIRKTNRQEENYAKKLFNAGSSIAGLGKVIECQIPLKDVRANTAGKIDLVSLADDGVFYLIELKYGDNKETLLRAVLEIAVYYQQLDREKFVSDFRVYSDPVRCSSAAQIKKAVLLGEKTQAYCEFKDLEKRPYLKKLIESLEVQLKTVPSS